MKRDTSSKPFNNAHGLVVTLVGLMITISAYGETGKTRSQEAIEEVFGHMVQEQCDWRTPNPFYEDQETPNQYAMRFKWGPYKQHVVGELVGIFSVESGEREAKYWSMYMYHNPATDEVTAMQIAWDGTLVSGNPRVRSDGALMVDQTKYDPTGQMSMIRHVEFPNKDENYVRSEVYERDQAGAWTKVREWKWTCTEHRTTDN